jgi:peptide/nickel transport system permease protein
MSLSRYIAQRLLLTVPVLVGMSLLVFLLLRLVPGDPALVILGLRATPEGVAAIHRDLGLDLPIYQQFLIWIANLLQGNLGQDYRSHEMVTTLLAQRLPVTIELSLLAMLISIGLAVPLGVSASRRTGGGIDRFALGLGVLGISIPDFWLAIMLILSISLGLGLLPSSGFTPFSEDPVGNIKSMALPAITLAAGLSAVLTRTTRSSMLDVLAQEFIKVSRAKGLPEGQVVYQHALPNAAIPIVTVIGLQSGYLLGGAVIVEQVFSLPGVGNLVVNATLERNYPVVQSAVLVVALMFILVNIFTDILYAYLNPRIRSL